MYDFLLTLHILLAIFAIGPLVHAATTAGRGIRKGDGLATAASVRLLRLYGYVSVLVVVTGIVLMGVDLPYGGGEVQAGELGQLWIWLSLVLWVIAISLILGVIVPTLDKATQLIAQESSVVSMTARVAAAGGVVALLFIVIVVLMVYRPGH